MKPQVKAIYCKRCGDRVSHEERLLTGDNLCALCDHMSSEALEIHRAVKQSIQNNGRLRLI